jgi:hypothetical protein
LVLLHLLVAVVAEQQALHPTQMLALALAEVAEAGPQVLTPPTTLVALELQVKATLVRLQPLVQVIMLALVVEALGRSALQT